VGAVPGSRLLSAPGPREGPDPFDVESFRSARRRVVLRDVPAPVVVLGSTQPDDVLDADQLRRRGVRAARRRSGGGAVLLTPGAQLWADLWIPADDPLWSREPRRSAVVAGAWWTRALGLDGMEVHGGASTPAPGSDMICFAGLGPGELSVEGRKVVGLAQWRSREGVLVHGCAYREWDPGPILELLALPSARRRMLAVALPGVAVGVGDLGVASSWGEVDLLRALPDAQSWDVVRA